MSALACIFADKGCCVTGSDPGSNRWTRALQQRGVQIYSSHKAEHIAGAQAVVVSTAIRPDNPELRAAREAGLTVLHRSEALAAVMRGGRAVAVTGTHGKTTVSAWLAFIATRLGLDPTFAVGGHVEQLGGNGRAGRGPHVVAEADESDGSFLRYRPHSAIVTNVEPEHMDHFGTFDRLLEAVEQFCRQVDPQGWLILSSDDTGLRRIGARLDRRPIWYSLRERQADFHAARLEPSAQGTSFDLYVSGRKADRLVITRPGTHNVANALAVIAWCRCEGLEWPQVRSALAEFNGAGRRFEIRGQWNGATIVDDYAHHPTEVLATLEAARERARVGGGRVVAVFQPHRFTRLADHHAGFAAALLKADAAGVLDVYAAGETPIPGVGSELIVRRLEQLGHRETVLCAGLEDAAQWLERTLRPGDVALTLGAGDVWKVGELLLQPVHSTPAAAR
ncbi:MAG: UDP-N-acetylmuramate--L-alanine ligase [Candidatus Sumerlaeia bacterium]